MPYKDKEKQKEYQREWMAKRRAIFFKDKTCAKCGSVNQLELDHIDSSTKISHRIWSWSQERRDKELKKCQVLCQDCHIKKGVDVGDLGCNYKITKSQVKEIIAKYNSTDISQEALGKEYGLCQSHISQIVTRKKRLNI